MARQRLVKKRLGSTLRVNIYKIAPLKGCKEENPSTREKHLQNGEQPPIWGDAAGPKRRQKKQPLAPPLCKLKNSVC